MSATHRPFYLAGEPTDSKAAISVLNKYNGSSFASVAAAQPEDIEEAIRAAAAAFEQTRRLAAFERERILRQLADAVSGRRRELVDTLVVEAGKPMKYAEIEVSRTIDILDESARCAVEQPGVYMPMDQTPRGAAYRAVWRRVPIGPVTCITPFNFPLALVAHKIGPAIAAGCPFLLKPASGTPMSALMLAELLCRTEWPKAAFSVLPCNSAHAAPLVTDARIRVLTFTGSAEVGWGLRATAGHKKVVLELGGNAAAIVCRDADPRDAARRCATGAFAQAGQSCISVQRIFVERSIYDEFKRHLVEAAGAMVVGNPARPETEVGPLIAESEARRLEDWVMEAERDGARVLCGARRDRATYVPTVIENARSTHRVSCCEAFGPIVTLTAFDDFADALRMVNDTPFGLQAGIFTNELHRAWKAFDVLDVGGVVINDVPTFRADNAPYGGMKSSGLGREGPRWAIEDYTEIKTILMRDG